MNQTLEQRANEFKEHQRISKLPEFIINKRQVPINQGYIDQGKWLAEDYTKPIQIGIDKEGKPIIGYNTIYINPNDYEHEGEMQGHEIFSIKRI